MNESAATTGEMTNNNASSMQEKRSVFDAFLRS